MRQVDWAAAEHLLSPFSSPFFGVKLPHDYGFRADKAKAQNAVLFFYYLHLDDVVCDGGATVGLRGRPGQVTVAGTPVKDIRPTRLRGLV
jgi:hypothetical protein